MASYNQWTGIANLCADPQLKYLPNQTPVVELRLACNSKYKTKSGEEREDVLYLDAVAFGRPAEILNQYTSKGKPIFLTGRLKTEEWEDRNGGGKRSKIKLMIETFQFLGGRDAGAGHGEEDQTRQEPQRQQRPAAKQSEPKDPFGDEQHFSDDSIPF